MGEPLAQNVAASSFPDVFRDLTPPRARSGGRGGLPHWRGLVQGTSVVEDRAAPTGFRRFGLEPEFVLCYESLSTASQAIPRDGRRFPKTRFQPVGVRGNGTDS